MNNYHRTCAVCAKPFVYHPAGKDKGREHVRGLCCSMACKSQYVRANRAPALCPVYAGYCKGCGSPFIAERARAYCRVECRLSAQHTDKDPAGAECKRCGAKYLVPSGEGRPTVYCSDECRAAATAAVRRVWKAKRKAVLRGATVERVDPFAVFARDGWRCQLCGEPTPQAKRGTYEDDAPELDHIVPLSRGGEHSYGNTQCACRSCNNLKADNSFFEPTEITMLLGENIATG